MKVASGTNNQYNHIKISQNDGSLKQALPLVHVTSASFILNDFKFFNYLSKRDLIKRTPKLKQT